MEELKDPFAGLGKTATQYQYGVIDDSVWYEDVRNGIIFEQNSLYGLKAENGNVIVEPQYEFIGKCSNCVLFLEPGGHYVKMTRGCKQSGFMQEGERPYVENGKVGIKVGGEILIPAEYNYIESAFGDLTVFLAVKDGREMYINDKCEEVLTRVRRFDGENCCSSPFWLCTDKFDIVTAMNYIGHCQKDNSNVVKLSDQWIELERYTKEDIMDMLVDVHDDLSVTEKDLRMLNNKFSYEYCVYFANAEGKGKWNECIDQFGKMHAFSNSWYYVVKIWQASGENVNAKELRSFIRNLKNKMRKNEVLGTPVYAIGHSDSLKPGEVRMLMITHYNERCFPPRFEYEWLDKCEKVPVNKLSEEAIELRDIIDENILPEYKEDMFHDLIENCIRDLKFYTTQTWEEAESALEKFFVWGSSMDHALFNFLGHAAENVGTKGRQILRMSFFLNASKWALSKHVDVNDCGFCKGQNASTLDILNIIKTHELDLNISTLVDELITKVKSNGGKTYDELKSERINNQDYYKELEYIKAKRHY